MHKKNVAIRATLDEEVGKYAKHPFFIRKAAAATRFLEKSGLPQALQAAHRSSKPAQIFVSHRKTDASAKKITWIVKRTGSARPVKVTTTQKEAIDMARAIARNKGLEVIIHGKDGKVRDRNNYVKDKNRNTISRREKVR